MIDNVILCVKKGKCYDSVDNIEYIANVSNDVRDVSFYPVSNMSLMKTTTNHCHCYTYAISYIYVIEIYKYNRHALCSALIPFIIHLTTAQMGQ